MLQGAAGLEPLCRLEPHGALARGKLDVCLLGAVVLRAPELGEAALGTGTREAPGHFAACVRDACRVHRVDLLPESQPSLCVLVPAGVIRPRNGRAGRTFLAGALHPAIRRAAGALPAAVHESRYVSLGGAW